MGAAKSRIIIYSPSKKETMVALSKADTMDRALQIALVDHGVHLPRAVACIQELEAELAEFRDNLQEVAEILDHIPMSKDAHTAERLNECFKEVSIYPRKHNSLPEEPQVREMMAGLEDMHWVRIPGQNMWVADHTAESMGVVIR